MNTFNVTAIIVLLIILFWPYLTKSKTWVFLLLGWLAWRWLKLTFQ